MVSGVDVIIIILADATSIVTIGGTGHVYLQRLSCVGDEASLFDCSQDFQFTTHFYLLCRNHYGDAGAICECKLVPCWVTFLHYLLLLLSSLSSLVSCLFFSTYYQLF